MATVAHPMIRDTAVGMAEEYYEVLAYHNEFRRLNPSRKRFVRLLWPKLLEQAREVLAGSLGEGSLLPEDQKELVAEALILDNQLRIGGRRVIGAFH